MGRKLKHDYKQFIERNANGESIIKMARELNINPGNIYRYFRINNIEPNKNIQLRHENYYVNDNYLDSIDTEDKAYFLGWMFSDGYVTGNTVALKLKKDDGYIIEKLFNYFSKGYKLSLSGDNKSRTISINSTQLSKRLRELGCIENKTLNGFKLPNIPEYLMNHFIRGYFDGDGSLSKRSARPNQIQVYICSIDKYFLEQLQNVLKDKNITTYIFLEKRNGKEMKLPSGKISTNMKDMYRLYLTTHKDKLRFYEYLYNNVNISLDRKHVLFKKYYTNTVLTLETKESKAVQRIGDETFINYDMISESTFKKGRQEDRDKVLELYKSGLCMFKIHKKLGVSRNQIKIIIDREYNSPTSAR